MICSTLQTWDMRNKRVFVRADLNVPLHNGTIINDFRLQNILPTIDYLLNHDATIILATHLGRPHDHEENLSTKILIPWFRDHGYAISFVDDVAKAAQQTVKPKHILLLENLRFFAGEKSSDPLFAKQLARTAEYYINDAFGLIHEHDCSTTVLPYEFPENKRSIGLLMEKELRMLDTLDNNPAHPFIAILGGGKIEEKIPLITSLLEKVDTLILCPAICFSFLAARNKPVGKSLVNKTLFDTCKHIMSHAQSSHTICIFPDDYQVAYDTIEGPLHIISTEQFPDNAIGIAVGPHTTEQIIDHIHSAKTIFFNCAMGFADRPETQKSTRAIIDAMALSSATTIIAGGDSVEVALTTQHYQKISHLSTGGGAALAYIGNKMLPGLAPFAEQ
jgi:phosphoglycerate kinase